LTSIDRFIHGNIPDLLRSIVQTNMTSLALGVIHTSNIVQAAFDANLPDMSRYVSLVRSVAGKFSQLQVNFGTAVDQPEDDAGIVNTISYLPSLLEQQYQPLPWYQLGVSCKQLMNKAMSINWAGTYAWNGNQLSSSWDGNVVQDYLSTVNSYCQEAADMVVYTWSEQSWSTCSASCGGGTQTRTVTCQSNAGVTASDSQCFGSKPSTTQSCNTQPCTYTWSVENWGTCSASCGGGVQTRIVTCKSDATGLSVSDSLCSSSSKPLAVQSCNTQACSSPSNSGATMASSCSLLFLLTILLISVFCNFIEMW